MTDPWEVLGSHPDDPYTAALETARTVDILGEEPEWEALDGLPLMTLLEVIGKAREQKRLADLVRNAAKRRAVDTLGDGASVTDGHTFYRVAPQTERTVKDAREFIQWLGPEDAANVLNMSFSIERFRELVASRGQDVGELEAHFFTVTRGEADLSEMPLTHRRVPKYAAGMEPGTIRRR